MSTPPRHFRPEPFAYHEVIELNIDALSNLGAGVGRLKPGARAKDDEGPAGHDPVRSAEPDPHRPGRDPAPDLHSPERAGGWVVFVPFALPGERVRARIWKNEANCSHADLLEVLTPSPHRIAPRCPLFGTCGGCQYQHFAYHRQLHWKRRQVSELLAHMAGIVHPVNEPIASPQSWNYRSKITPHFQKPLPGKELPIGFLVVDSRRRIVDVPSCPIAMPAINAALPAERQRVRQRAAQGKFRKGATLLLRATANGVQTNPRDVAEERVDELTFRFLAGDFFQNNPFILPAFVAHVAKQAAAGCRFLVDAYCGAGLFGLSLARNFAHVAGVEVSESSADWARLNAKANHLDNVTIFTASAEHIFDRISFPPNETAVVIDPPRKGCGPGFLGQLFAFGPRRIVYVSCNPSTQIRDLRHFEDHGYALTDIQPFDLFPQTKHLECVVTLVRSA